MNTIEQRARELLSALCSLPISAGEEAEIALIAAAIVSQPEASAPAVPGDWRPIAEAPEGRLCVVGWLDPDDSESPERHNFDYIEDGCWVEHANLVEYADAVAPAGSSMPPRDAPYRWFIEIPSMIAAAPAPDSP
ncbi:hypothetical protein [Xanthomonas sp. SHU 199]|uniref:hypothetical protein n=1 Tax=Xanthomonas sp. SHU 199 TaxID=1591174 RepID=UPI00036033F6|nr:hypothetical protein [Xanthomonas sp. SHU 199]